MKACQYKCVITWKPFDQIHHLYGFGMILEETLKELKMPLYEKVSEYTQQELKSIVDKCMEIHYKHPLGACLSKGVHILFHTVYGRKNNTPEQFEEFKQRCSKGEFELKEVS
jgi:hypothetical protein